MGRPLLWLCVGICLGACADTRDATEEDETGHSVDAGPERSRADASQAVDAAEEPAQRDAGPGQRDAGPAQRDGATAQTDASASGSSDAATKPDAAPPAGDAGPVTGNPTTPINCGASAIALESAGPPKNRVNYVIAGDGYTEAELGTTYMQHLNEMLRWRFMAALEPYTRYRKFINICALKVASPKSGIGTMRGDSAFGGYGNDQTRLGYIEDAKVRDAMTRLLPKEIEVDWVAVVLNDSSWWNAGGRYMVWSGGNKDAGLAAMHEGGHSFQLLADEYGGSCTYSGDEARMRINVTKDGTGTAGKWTKWLDFNHTPGTGMQGIFEGAEYCDKGAFRPTKDSVMNSLWKSSYFNAISLEQAVRVIYKMVKPIDSNTPTTTTTPGELTVDVVDPAVIKLEWYVDEQLKAGQNGRALNVASLGLSPGMHSVRARAFDDTPWVRGDRKELEQSVTWMIQVP